MASLETDMTPSTRRPPRRWVASWTKTVFDVRRQDLGPLLAAVCGFFFVLTALMLLRPVRDAVGMAGGMVEGDQQFALMGVCVKMASQTASTGEVVFFRGGVGAVLMIPAVAILLGFAALTASPLPLLVAVVQIVTRAGEFSLAKPARETIYTRVDREVRYKGKAVIDTAVYRGGDLFFVWTHKLLAAFGSAAVFGVGMLVAGAMTFGAWRLIREQAKLPADPR